MSDDGPPIRVVVVDDHELVASGVESILARSGRIEVVGTAFDVDAAMDVARRLRPDVVIMDYQLGSSRTPPSFPALQEASGAAILVLTGHPSESAMLESFDRGATGFLSKEQSSEALVEGVVRVAAGEIVVSPDLLPTLAARSLGKDQSLLSRRELEVLELLAQGADTEAMAQSLGLSVNTVRNHIAKVSMRLGVHSRLEAVSEAVRRGIISPPAPGRR